MFPALALLFQALPVQQFPMVPPPGSTPDVAPAIRAACPAGRGLDRTGLLRYEIRRADSAASHPSAGNWTALGCARALLWEDGAVSHDGPLMITGDSWAAGGIARLARGAASSGPAASRRRPACWRCWRWMMKSALDALKPLVTAALGRAVAAGAR